MSSTVVQRIFYAAVLLAGLASGAAAQTISQAFGASVIPPNQVTTLTLTINGPLASGWTVSDTMPTGIQGYTATAPTTVCSTGTPVTTAAALSFSGGPALPTSGDSCTITYSVQATSEGIVNNFPELIEAGTGTIHLPSSGSITVQKLTFTKAFHDPKIAVNHSTNLEFTIINTASIPVSNVGFTDNLATIFFTVASAGTSSNCGSPTLTAPIGGSSIAVSGISIAMGATCTVDIMVTGTVASSSYNNQAIGTGLMAGTSTPSASIQVGPPVLTKSFNPTTIPANGTTTMTITINNNTASTLTGIGFNDPLSSFGLTGVTIANPVPSGPNNPCGLPVVATATSVSLSGATIAAGATCTVMTQVQVGATATVNLIDGVGDLAVQQYGIGITVAKPQFTKTVTTATVTNGSSANVSPGDTGTFTITVNNNTGLQLTNVAFADTLPAGLTYGAVTTTCGGGGTVPIVSGKISIAAFTLNTGISCTVTIPFTAGATVGLNTNTATGATGSNLDGLTASASVTIQPPVSIIKSFLPATIPLGGTSTMTITISNPTAAAVTGAGFTDMLPAGMALTIAPTGSLCGGTLSGSTTSVTLTGATVAAAVGATPGTCTFTGIVNGTQAGALVNTATPTGSISSLKSVTATLNVRGPIKFSKMFSPTTIPLNGFSTLTLTIVNNSGLSAAIGFADGAPAGLQFDTGTTPMLTGCGGATATETSSLLQVTGGTLPDGMTCTVVVRMQGVSTGTWTNSATGSGDLTGLPPATAVITVLPPTFSKAFSKSSVQLNQTVDLTFTIVNPDPVSTMTNASFTDPLPAGVEVSTSSFDTNGNCGSPVFTPALGNVAILNVPGATLNLSGGTILPLATCTITVHLTAVALGHWVNVATGTNPVPLTGLTATATLDVVPPALNPYQLRYFSNLNIGGNYINLTNDGGSSTVASPVQNGNICVNVYAFTPDEQLAECCSCLITPNALARLDVANDLASNPLTPAVPTSLVVKLLATADTACNPATIMPMDLRSGLVAYGTTVHALPALPGSPLTTYGMVEGSFAARPLTLAEMTRMTTLCGLVKANGSGHGVCKSCATGAQYSVGIVQ